MQGSSPGRAARPLPCQESARKVDTMPLTNGPFPAGQSRRGRRRAAIVKPRRHRHSSPAAELLEPRALLAVTAALNGGNLEIDYNAVGDVLAEIVSDGSNYTVSGTGLGATPFAIASVTGRIVVADKGSIPGQSFRVLAGTPLANALRVTSAVETATLEGGIAAAVAGDVVINAPAIALANDISTAATKSTVRLSGAVTLGANVTVNSRIPGDYDRGHRRRRLRPDAPVHIPLFSRRRRRRNDPAGEPDDARWRCDLEREGSDQRVRRPHQRRPNLRHHALPVPRVRR